MIKQGTRWSGSDRRVFVVIETVNLDGKNWVHYRPEKPIDHLPSEFSCYEESFLSRFTALPE